MSTASQTAASQTAAAIALPSTKALGRAILSLLPPLAALALQWQLWPVIQPYVWFLFYPAVIVSAAVGGTTGGVAATVLSTTIAIAIFVPRQPAPNTPGVALSAIAFMGMGFLFSTLLGRYRRAVGRLASLIEQASDGVFVADLDGRYTDVNDAGCRMLGYTRDDIVGRSIADFIPPEDLARLARDREEFAKGAVKVEEWRLRRKDGSWLNVEVSAKILPDGRWQGLVRDVTERRRMEKALRESHAELDRAQAIAQVGSWRLDVLRNRLVWSDESHRIFGLPRGLPLTYETFLSTVHPDDREEVDRRWKAALHGAPYDIEHRIVVDGAVKWVRERASLEFDEAGTLLGGIGTTQDITAQKGAAERLQRAHGAERRLRGELEELTRASSAVSDAVADLPRTDLNAVLHIVALQAQTLVNAQFVALGVGADPDKPFEPWLSVGVPQETAEAIGRSPRPVGTFAHVAAQGEVLRLADVCRHPAFRGLPPHHPTVTSFLGVPIRYRGRSVGNLYLGNRIGAAEFSEQDQRLVEMLAARAGVAIETARLYSDEALRRTWLQTMIDQMPEAVVFLDEAGHVVLRNRSAVTLGRTTERLDPRGRVMPFDLRFPDGRPVPPDQLPIFRALDRGATVAGGEFAVVAPDDRWVPILVSAAPVRVESRITGAVAVFQDISAMKQLERMREEWASIVAHDLRQPVSVIQMTAEVLERSPDGALSETQRKAVERIRSSAARLGRMTADLLDASRIEAHRLSLDCRAIDLVPIVEETVEHLRDAREGVDVEVLAGREQPAFADPDRVRQVLENLLGNAVKYGRPGSPIRVEVASRDDHVEVVVENAGPGIPPDQVPLLFNRFARTREARAGKTRGLGLGLYISHGLVQAHGGRMWVDSIPGDTTRFHFTLPTEASLGGSNTAKSPGF